MRGERETRFKARPQRRLLLYWYQPLIVVGLSLLLWRELDFETLCWSSRTFAPLPASCVAYVVLDPEESAEAMRLARSEWLTTNLDQLPAFSLDLGLDEWHHPKPELALGSSDQFLQEWQPELIALESPPLPELGSLRSMAALPEVRVEGLYGIRVEIGRELQAVGFQVKISESDLRGSSGSAQFYVESVTDGSVAHVLQLTGGQQGGFLSRTLMQGKAAGAARGRVEIVWRLKP